MQPHYKNVSDLLASIVNRSCFHGFGCMQYKLDPKDSAVKVIEVSLCAMLTHACSDASSCHDADA
jgi:predicted ATP-grasp superfamily ATP-dependent carboligase